jgi:hypothetical protein
MVLHGNVLPLRFQLTGASAGIGDAVIRAYLVPLTPEGAEAIPLIARPLYGDPNDNVFHYDSTSGQYRFDLNTRGYRTGTYALRMYLGSDPKVDVLQGEAALTLE